MSIVTFYCIFFTNLSNSFFDKRLIGPIYLNASEKVLINQFKGVFGSVLIFRSRVYSVIFLWWSSHLNSSPFLWKLANKIVTTPWLRSYKEQASTRSCTQVRLKEKTSCTRDIIILKRAVRALESENITFSISCWFSFYYLYFMFQVYCKKFKHILELRKY